MKAAGSASPAVGHQGGPNSNNNNNNNNNNSTAIQNVRESVSRLLEGLGRRDAAGHGEDSPREKTGKFASNDAMIHTPDPHQDGYGSMGDPSSSSFSQGFPGSGPHNSEGAPGGPMLPGAYAGPKSAQGSEIFAPLFTVGCLMVFLTPIWQLVYLTQDADVQFWLGRSWGQLAALLPLMFVGGFFAHLKLRRPHRLTALLSLLVPSMVLLVEGHELMGLSLDKASGLRSANCQAFEGKQLLQDSWVAADRLLESCKKDGQSVLLPDCSGYWAARVDHREDWDYLESLETRHGCAGWCQDGRQLWTLGKAQDSCSTAVAQVFSQKAARTSLQVMVYSTCVLVVACSATVAVVVWQRQGHASK
mmetsp:Transcript_20172/g.35879  ORF Transcript_20172/g.35879 Transcript_20172/m.35879 type:complete len:361 (+) Transcript_20172:152-1234(+)